MSAEISRLPIAHTARKKRRVDLILIGARGQVGAAFARQLSKQQTLLATELNLDLKILAAFDRRGFVFSLQGLSADHIETQLSPRLPNDSERLLAHLEKPDITPTLVIDCTASDDVADLYPRLLANGVGIVAANKRANSREISTYRELQRLSQQHDAPYRYETTVGAAIPVLGPLRDLRLRGESILSIEGVLSGSLSFIINRLHEGQSFSAAVAQARELGYTEPDPLEDLRALDVSRKVLVLAREAGFGLNIEQLKISPLTALHPAPGQDVISALQSEDEAWRERISAVEARGNRLVFIAYVDAMGGCIELREVPAQSPFAQLKAGQNRIVIRTALQDESPLILSGPGAGPEITAAGVLSDVIAAAGAFRLG